MDKFIKACELDLLPGYKKDEDGNLYYKTEDGKVFKVFWGTIAINLKSILMEKLSNARDINGVVKPEQIVVSPNNDIVGYTFQDIPSITEKEYRESLSDEQIHDFARVISDYNKIESIIRGAGEDVVFPELFGRVKNNLIVDTQGNYHVTNYDTIQVGDYSSVLLHVESGYLSKYLTKPAKSFGTLFSKDLDRDALVRYFLDTTFGFNFDGRDVRYRHKFALENLKSMLGGDSMDKELFEKLSTYFYRDVQTPYIGEDLERIKDKYKIVDADSLVMDRKLVLK